MASHTHADHGTSASTGLAGKIGWGRRPALLLVDVCRAYWSPGSPLDTSSNPASAAALDAIRELVATARDGNTPLVWTRVQYTEPDTSDAGLFVCKAPLLSIFNEAHESGLRGWVEGLEPRASEIVISKRYPSAFFATDLNTRLQLKGIDTLVICGVSTSGCIRATALDAMCYGYRPMVVGEACGDRTPAVHGANLFDMNAKMADVVGLDEARSKMTSGGN